MQRPEFPADMPKELQDQIMEMLESVHRHAHLWRERFEKMEETEFAGLVIALEVEKERRVIDKIAEMPDVQAAVMNKQRGNRNKVTDLPEIISLPATNNDRMN